MPEAEIKRTRAETKEEAAHSITRWKITLFRALLRSWNSSRPTTRRRSRFGKAIWDESDESFGHLAIRLAVELIVYLFLLCKTLSNLVFGLRHPL